MAKKVRNFLKTDLPLWAILVLAALAVPRVVIHDLHLADLNSAPYKVLATVPFLIWFGVAVFRKSSKPLADFLVMGIVFGTLLAITHQLLWHSALNGQLPQLNTTLDPVMQEVVLRIAAVLSSIVTGAIIGAFFGCIAELSNAIRGKLRR